MHGKGLLRILVSQLFGQRLQPVRAPGEQPDAGATPGAFPDQRLADTRLAGLRRRALCRISAQLDTGSGAVREWLATLNCAVLQLREPAAQHLRDRNAAEDWDEF